MRVTLKAEEAIGCLPEGEVIHVFTNPGGMLIGADWGRADVVEAIENAEKIEVGGPGCRGMKHGIVVFPKGAKFQSDLYFVESVEDKLKIYDMEEKDETGR